MKNDFEIINGHHSKSELPFVNKSLEEAQVLKNVTDYNIKVKRDQQKKPLVGTITKEASKKPHEYSIGDYLLFYLILFAFIGISTFIIMGTT